MIALPLREPEMVITNDSALRQMLLGPSVMRHPAKQSIPQLLHLLRRFAVPGGVLLDPFGGSGSAMLAASPAYAGMHVITVELAQHFLAIQREAWAHFSCSIDMQDAYGTPPGTYTPLSGDSRDLVGVLRAAGGAVECADLIVTSPSYGGSEAVDRRTTQNTTIAHHGGGNTAKTGYQQIERLPEPPGHKRRGKHGLGPHSQLSAAMNGYRATQPISTATHAPVVLTDEAGYKGLGQHFGGRLQRDGCVDTIVTSPPYQDSLNPEHASRGRTWQQGEIPPVFRAMDKRGQSRAAYVRGYDAPPDGDDQIVDLVVTSPPYHDAISGQVGAALQHARRIHAVGKDGFYEHVGPSSQIALTNQYDTTRENIGNLRGNKYLDSMALVWGGCAALLKPGGILCCITRDCVRAGKRVPVGEQNKALLIAAGLEFVECETWTLSQQSFWRILQARKNPSAPIIDSEIVQIFRKPIN